MLPESSFLQTNEFKDSLGVSPDHARVVSDERIGHWLDISEGIKRVRRNSVQHPWVRFGCLDRFAFNAQERYSDQAWWRPYGCSGLPFSQADRLPNFQDITRDASAEAPGSGSRERGRGRAGRRSSAAGGGGGGGGGSGADDHLVLRDGSSILRTYEMDMELRSHVEDGVGVMFQNVTWQTRPQGAVLPSLRWAAERLANLLHVPELSLVVAASMCGRVALVTLTRPADPSLRLKRGFRVDAILPTRDDEDDQLRPLCPLLGVAVGPLPISTSTSTPDRHRKAGPPRYRLMLHYYDMRILSYELRRDSEELSIV